MFSARDNGHIDEIIKNLICLEEEYNISLTEEKNWLNGLKNRFHRWKNSRTTLPEQSTEQILSIENDGTAHVLVGRVHPDSEKWVFISEIL